MYILLYRYLIADSSQPPLMFGAMELLFLRSGPLGRSHMEIGVTVQ